MKNPTNDTDDLILPRRSTLGWCTLAAVFLYAMGVIAVLSAQTTLSVGDIGITGFNTNAPDGFTFVLYREVAAGTVIKFTDNGFLSAASAIAVNNGRGGENFVTWTAPAGGLAAGSVVRMVNSSGSVTTVTGGGTAVLALNGLSNSGDQIFVYQGPGSGVSASTSDFGTNANPSTFSGSILYGLNTQAAFLTTGTATSNTSYLPSELAGNNANIALFSAVTSGKYTGDISSLTAAAYANAVANPTNWTTLTGAALTTLSTSGFTINNGAAFVWDSNGTTANTGGTGTWDATTTNRWSDTANTTFFKNWVNSTLEPIRQKVEEAVKW